MTQGAFSCSARSMRREDGGQLSPEMSPAMQGGLSGDHRRGEKSCRGGGSLDARASRPVFIVGVRWEIRGVVAWVQHMLVGAAETKEAGQTGEYKVGGLRGARRVAESGGVEDAGDIVLGAEFELAA